MKRARYLVSAPLVVLGALLAVYGLGLLVYEGESGGPTYVKVAGSDVDAHLAGGSSMVGGAVLLASAWWLLAQRRRPGD